MLVEVALPVPVRTSFTYELPERWNGAAQPGSRVRVPFGKRTLIGIVLGPSEARPAGTRIREVEQVLDGAPLLTPAVLALVRWIADYYQAPVGEAAKLALPPRLPERRSSGSPKKDAPGALPHLMTAGEDVPLVRLAPGRGAEALPLDRRASRLRAIVDTLAAGARADGWMMLERLRALTGASAAHLAKLEARGWIERGISPPSAGGAPEPNRPSDGPALTPLQKSVAAEITRAIDAEEPAVFVLRGITGSGKTEIYFHAARRALDRGRGVIFLVPEISLTPVFTRRVRARFGEMVALIHSRLSVKERTEAWMRVRSGQAPLVVGPRSALFAPVARCGLIVVDEEHDGSYKQEEAPRYHARDMALVRARLEKAVALLGSATPSVESWHGATSGRYRRLELTERIAGRPLPDVEIVDMREEFRARGAPILLSQRLRDAVTEAVGRGEQGVILINRRGYAAFALCRACGEPIGCPHCSVSLVYHRADESLRCHYCDHRRPRPETCPACGSPHLVFQGEGTERVERHLARVLPGVRLARLDRDTAGERGAHERILTSFEEGGYDLLVGTQMVAKGHDFPGVTVVGVLSADAILGFPDFRAAERTFQLLTQVAGRAGRGDRPGRVLVQAYRTDHFALQASIRHDHQAFFAREIQYRKMLAYPPFANLAAVTVVGTDLARTAARAREVASLVAIHGGGYVRMLGPALAPLARIRGRYRFQVLLKARARGRLGDTLGRVLEELDSAKGGTRDLVVDVDPLQLL